MTIDIIQDRLNQYHSKNLLEEENAMKEITQEIALMALARADFFKVAEFYGGTALRILYQLPRFSEDLDFALLKPTSNFEIAHYLKKIVEEFSVYGYELEVEDRSKANNVVKKAFLKDESLGKILKLNYPILNGVRKKIQIKLEIDTNPALGATTEIRYLDFPLPFAILCKDLASSFAGKCHALLCRKYIKGRDWYDFIWYIARSAPINFKLLSNACKQIGPWQGQILQCNYLWLTTELKRKIESIDWEFAKQDIRRFLSAHEQRGLEMWSREFFISCAEKLLRKLPG